jgi:hypothetical protein
MRWWLTQDLLLLVGAEQLAVVPVGEAARRLQRGQARVEHQQLPRRLRRLQRLQPRLRTTFLSGAALQMQLLPCIPCTSDALWFTVPMQFSHNSNAVWLQFQCSLVAV